MKGIGSLKVCEPQAVALVLLASLGCSLRGVASDVEQQREHFERHVRPILSENCYECHSARAEKIAAELLLDSRQRLLTGGDSGPAIVPGQPDSSLLMEAVRYESYEMPPRGQLAPDQIAHLEQWIASGAYWPDEPEPEATAAPDNKFDLHARKRAHWAWQPVSDPNIPEVEENQKSLTAIDAFILDRLNQRGLTPAPPVDRQSLVRRLYFDLIGMPPAAEDLDRYAGGSASREIAVLIDELLNSPHFGERWGRHWFDLVRYAESRGHEFDNDAPNAYQYRDYVIRALNADVPYDQFVYEHIAGDLLEAPRLHPEHGFNESVIGTGFWFFGEWAHSPVDTRKDECDRFDNMIDVMSKTFLGLTVACARCHDHKFDAISTHDYYSLTGFLQSSDYRQVRFESLEQNRRVATSLATLEKATEESLRSGISKAILRQLPHIEQYWTAAEELLASPEGSRTESQLSQAASTRSLDRALLASWLERLRRTGTPAQRQAGPTHSAPAKLVARSADELHSVQTILDFATPTAGSFLPDGFMFGHQPAPRGKLHIHGAPGKPEMSVTGYAAARKDRLWDGLSVEASPVTNQKNKLDLAAMAGRTLRSPTFELLSGHVSYLIRGGCRAVACVDSHRLLFGPLHGETVLDVEADGESLRWVTHTLDRYRGRRLHIELVAQPNVPLEVLRIIDGVPTEREQSEARQLSQVGPAPGTGADAEFGFPLELQRALEAWTRADGAGVTQTQADLLAWAVRNLDLLVTAKDLSLFDHLAESYLRQRAKLAEEIVNRSATAMAIRDGSAEDDRILIRGNHQSVGQIAPRRFLEALAGAEPLDAPHRSGRLELAAYLVAEDNPLTDRVLVNRVWHHLFGRGIVPTVDDFGFLGQPPTHPELLDHLVVEFRERGRSIKSLVRYIVSSHTYRMSSSYEPESLAADPTNASWHYRPVRRLEGEAIRDALLTISGGLDRSMFGPSVPIHLTEFMDGRGRPSTSGPMDGDGRRSVYVAVRRNFLSPFMLAFDTPSPFSTMGRRNVSNVPAQSLILMNDPFVLDQAEKWAERALNLFPADGQQRLRWMYLTAFGRSPSHHELALVSAHLKTQPDPGQVTATELQTWTEIAQALINVKEFIFIP